MIKLTGDRAKFYTGLFVLLAFFVALRLRTAGHLLMWDEAWNIFSIRAHVVNNTQNPFYWFYYFHPPLYIFFAELLSPFKAGFDIRLEYLTLIFSAGTFVSVYYLAGRIGGWKYALLSGLSLAFMPGSIAYSTWIKRDSLAVFCGFLAILLLVNRRFFWSFLLLGLSMLSKENGVFFVIAAVALIFILREEKPFLKVLFLFLVVTVSSAWWYVFFSKMTHHGINYFFTETDYSLQWAGSAAYYLTKLSYDVGWINIFLLSAGSCFVVYRAIKSEKKWMTGPVIFISVYAPISLFFTLKTPWLNIPALPAIAMLIGAGSFWLFEVTSKYRMFRAFFYAAVLASLIPGTFFSYADYHSATYPNGWPGARASRDIALYLNKNMAPDDSFMITEFTYWDMPICPVFLFYNEKDKFKLVRFGEKAESLIATIKKEQISYLVIVGEPEPTAKTAFRELSRDVRDLTGKEPAVVGWCYVWNTRSLWKN